MLVGIFEYRITSASSGLLSVALRLLQATTDAYRYITIILRLLQATTDAYRYITIIAKRVGPS